MKKVICTILSLSLILLPCSVFADTASGSAIRLDDRLKLAELSGVATPSSAIQLAAAATATEVTPSLYSVQPYYYNGTSTGSIPSTFLSNASNWDGLISGISYSVAYSIRSLGAVVSTAGTNVDSAVTSVYNQLVNIRGYVDDLESGLSTANSRLLSIANKSVASPTNVSDAASSIGANISNAASSIVSAIQSLSFTVPQSLLDDVDSINTEVSAFYDYPWGYYAYYKDHPNVTLSRINTNGNLYTQSVYTSNLDWFGMMQYWFVQHVNNVANGLDRVTGDVVGSSGYDLYGTDLTATSIPQNSVWYDIRAIGSNLSLHLSRLGYVLANDEDIEARQAAQTNTEAVVDDFIKPTGSAAASVSDFGSVADIASAGKDSLSSGVSPSVFLDQLGGDGDGWDWFSQHIQDELSAPSGRSNLRSNSKSNTSDTPYLDAYYRDLQEKIGIKLW